MRESIERDPSIRSLIELGTNGFFPLFDQIWLEEILQERHRRLTKKDCLQAEKIVRKLAKYENLPGKKILLTSLEKGERNIFIKVFLKLVEERILDKKNQIH